MRENMKPILVLCDAEEEYAQLMSEFIRRQKEAPWEVHTYTNTNFMLQTENAGTISVLVIAENTYCEEVKGLKPLRTVILNESGLLRLADFVNVDKYQQAQNVLDCIWEVFADVAEVLLPRLNVTEKTRFVGLYSPVRRCLQTSFGLTLAQLLSEKYRTLYLNFEHYAGISELAAGAEARDLADLLYYLTADLEKFRLRMQTLVQHREGLDYVPPMKAGQNLLSVGVKDWLHLFRSIADLGDYDYVVMDLSDNLQGLFEILRQCRLVFTITKKDRLAHAKLLQYEELLRQMRYEDVLDKTKKCEIPQIRRLPESLEQFTKGELAEYARGRIRELEEVG